MSLLRCWRDDKPTGFQTLDRHAMEHFVVACTPLVRLRTSRTDTYCQRTHSRRGRNSLEYTDHCQCRCSQTMSYLRIGTRKRREPSAKKLRNFRFRSCLSKLAYTIEEAEARITNAALPLTFYKCRFCDGHHLTSRVTPSDAATPAPRTSP